MTESAAVIGLGLIGGSLLRRLAEVGVAAIGYDTDSEAVRAARAAGLHAADTPPRNAPMTIVAVPHPALEPVFRTLAGGDGIVTDVTSVKASVAALARRYDLDFVGGHPMAGTERSGFAAGSAELFRDRRWVLTLDANTAIGSWRRVASLVCNLGAHVVPADPAAHDAAVARVSHLPHVLAAVLTLIGTEDPLAGCVAAGSFADATRVAATRPELSAAMCDENAVELAAVIDQAVRRLRVLPVGESDRLFRPAQQAYRRWADRTVTEHTLRWADIRDPTAELAAIGSRGGWIRAIDSEGIITCIPQ